MLKIGGVMKELNLHTPEGVRDIYNIECAERKSTISRILDELHLHGNHDIETPTFEYFDILQSHLNLSSLKKHDHNLLFHLILKRFVHNFSKYCPFDQF